MLLGVPSVFSLLFPSCFLYVFHRSSLLLLLHLLLHFSDVPVSTLVAFFHPFTPSLLLPCWPFLSQARFLCHSPFQPLLLSAKPTFLGAPWAKRALQVEVLGVVTHTSLIHTLRGTSFLQPSFQATYQLYHGARSRLIGCLELVGWWGCGWVRTSLPVSIIPALTMLCESLAFSGSRQGRDVTLRGPQASESKGRVSDLLLTRCRALCVLISICQAFLEESKASAIRVMGVGSPRCWLILGSC